MAEPAPGDTLVRSGVWVYGVVAEPGPERLHRPGDDRPVGVAGAPLRTVTADGLTAVVATVDLTGFGVAPDAGAAADPAGVAAPAPVDPGLLERAAWEHHDVLAMLAGEGASVPLRLATIYGDDARVEDMLRRQRSAFRSALELAAGRTEWGVKGWVTARPAGDAPPAVDSSARPGTSYLLRRRDERRLAARAAEEIDRYAGDMHRTLSAVATVARRFPVTGPAEPGADRAFFSGAYLVPDEREEQFALAVRGLGESAGGSRVRVAVTGPWPPYTVGFAADAGGA